jgi:phosphoribosyl-ATP pyrophosphohydrolase
MSDTILKDMYAVILDRKQNPMEGSYTCYLFEKGLDKILKKVGEESAETIIAAKNDVPEDTVGEINDLIYHVLVMMAELNIPLEDVLEEMEKRSRKIGNLKKMHVSDHNT